MLYAQRNVILVLHHDTLVIERRFERHREDIKWIAVDNVSEQGAGRIAVSYDAGHSTVVWDILTGREIARFVAYDAINVAHFMRNGNIAFGESQMIDLDRIRELIERQVMFRVPSYCSNHPQTRTSVRARFSILSLLLLLQATTGPSQSGTNLRNLIFHPKC